MLEAPRHSASDAVPRMPAASRESPPARPDTAAGPPPTQPPLHAAHSLPRLGCYEDLPGEIRCLVAYTVFGYAVDDARYDVRSLACNARQQALLHAELQAHAVLLRILEATTLPGLADALADVPALYRSCRPACLRAAIRVLTRVDPGPAPFAPPWHLLRPLLAEVPEQHDGVGGGRSALLLRLTTELRADGSPFDPFACAVEVLGMLDRRTPVPARLADALVGWVCAIAEIPDEDWPERAGGLLQAAPAALRPRLEKLFDFIATRNARTTALPEYLDDLEQARVEGRPEFDWMLRSASRFWNLRRNTDSFRERYRAWFPDLTPHQQAWLAERGRSPLAVAELVPFFATLRGRLPTARLLEALHHCAATLSPRRVQDCCALVEDIVRAAVGTPALAPTLHAVIEHWMSLDERLPALVTHCLSQMDDDEEELSVGLHLQVGQVGTGDFNAALRALRQPASRSVDALLGDRDRPHAAALQMLVEMPCHWLDADQRVRLIEASAALPAPASVRLLTQLVQQIRSLRSPGFAAPVLRAALHACGDLEPQHQAGPLVALLRALRGEAPGTVALHRAAWALYDALPTALRPRQGLCNAPVWRPAPPAGPGQARGALTPPGAAARHPR